MPPVAMAHNNSFICYEKNCWLQPKFCSRDAMDVLAERVMERDAAADHGKSRQSSAAFNPGSCKTLELANSSPILVGQEFDFSSVAMLQGCQMLDERADSIFISSCVLTGTSGC
jgi:hypothetical protein